MSKLAEGPGNTSDSESYSSGEIPRYICENQFQTHQFRQLWAYKTIAMKYAQTDFSDAQSFSLEQLLTESDILMSATLAVKNRRRWEILSTGNDMERRQMNLEEADSFASYEDIQITLDFDLFRQTMNCPFPPAKSIDISQFQKKTIHSIDINLHNIRNEHHQMGLLIRAYNRLTALNTLTLDQQETIDELPQLLRQKFDKILQLSNESFITLENKELVMPPHDLLSLEDVAKDLMETCESYFKILRSPVQNYKFVFSDLEAFIASHKDVFVSINKDKLHDFMVNIFQNIYKAYNKRDEDESRRSEDRVIVVNMCLFREILEDFRLTDDPLFIIDEPQEEDWNSPDVYLGVFIYDQAVGYNQNILDHGPVHGESYLQGEGLALSESEGIMEYYNFKLFYYNYYYRVGNKAHKGARTGFGTRVNKLK